MELYYNVFANVHLLFDIISLLDENSNELLKISYRIIRVTKRLYHRVIDYENGLDYREMLYRKLKFDVWTRAYLQYQNYVWNKELIPMITEKYRFVDKLIYRSCADTTAYMLCSKFYYNIIDSILKMKEFSSENWKKEYV